MSNNVGVRVEILTQDPVLPVEVLQQVRSSTGAFDKSMKAVNETLLAAAVAGGLGQASLHYYNTARPVMLAIAEAFHNRGYAVVVEVDRSYHVATGDVWAPRSHIEQTAKVPFSELASTDYDTFRGVTITEPVSNA